MFNYDHQKWDEHRSPARHMRHFLRLPSSNQLDRLTPTLMRIGLNTGLLTFYNMAVLADLPPLCIPPEMLAMPTIALGLLVTFRLNASYQRFDAARNLWGKTINTTRDLARSALQWLPSSPDQGASKQQVLRLINAYVITLKFHVNENGCYYELHDPQEINDKLVMELKEKAHLSEQEIQSCCATGNRPLWALQQLGSTMERASRVGGVDVVFQREMDSKVFILTDVLGGCERILRTPLPTSYTRHTSRFLFMWAHAVPWVLYPATGLATLPCSLFVAWALLGVEDAGVRIEEPFKDLPLWQYCNAIHDSMAQLQLGDTSGVKA